MDATIWPAWALLLEVHTQTKYSSFQATLSQRNSPINGISFCKYTGQHLFHQSGKSHQVLLNVLSLLKTLRVQLQDVHKKISTRACDIAHHCQFGPCLMIGSTETNIQQTFAPPLWSEWYFAVHLCLSKVRKHTKKKYTSTCEISVLEVTQVFVVAWPAKSMTVADLPHNDGHLWQFPWQSPWPWSAEMAWLQASGTHQWPCWPVNCCETMLRDPL